MEHTSRYIYEKITEDYVSIEVAKAIDKMNIRLKSNMSTWVLAKDKGDESKYFTCLSEDLDNHTNIDEETYHNAYHVMTVPTQSLVVKWLRERCQIEITQTPSIREKTEKGLFMFEITRKATDDTMGLDLWESGEKYNEALDKAILNALGYINTTK